MEQLFSIEFEKKRDEIPSFEAYKALIFQRRGVIIGARGTKRFIDVTGIRNIIAEFGDSIIGTPMGEDYHIVCSEEDLVVTDAGIYLDGDALVVKTDVYGEMQYLTKTDLAIIEFLFEKRIVFLDDGNGSTFPAIMLERRAA
ncbi:hypothetical protein [Butyrivibrio sp. AC2005]|uniref:hypothetical protein n=1 Tax=Butyrivibrio sp. AC2005 TaxID=1280672 RepID=UPI0003FD7D45|nr:hypothetical protein [Butyrivibrio sp. AC2005]